VVCAVVSFPAGLLVLDSISSLPNKYYFWYHDRASVKAS